MVTRTRTLSAGFGGISAGISSTPPQHMFFLEGGLLVVTNLLKTDAWVLDTERSHCNVCVQQFMAFRRRHHCRTCGEVVCGSCSSQRKIHLTEVNVECATRVCSFCMIRATDASITATNECLMRESLAIHARASLPNNNNNNGGADLVASRLVTSSLPAPPTMMPPFRPHPSVAAATTTSTSQLPPRPSVRPQLPPHAHPHSHAHAHGGGGPSRVSKQMSMLSLESELTDGSVVQLWPPVAADNETVRLEIARNSTIRNTESDPTMALLVSIVARTLECPVAFIGILDDHNLWFKATVGWDRTHILRDDCVCAIQQKTMVVADTNQDKHFHANTLSIDGLGMRYYAGAPICVLGQCIGAVSAIDVKPHWETSASMKSTLEAVANIVSEVLEQRVDGTRQSLSPFDPMASLAKALPQQQPQRSLAVSSEERARAAAAPPPRYSSPVKLTLLPKSQSTSSCESESTLVDFNDSMPYLVAIQSSEPSIGSDCESEFDEDELDKGQAHRERRASETEPPPVSSVYPWPATATATPPKSSTTSMAGRMSTVLLDSARPSSSMAPFTLPMPAGTPEVSERISKAMEFFQTLQSSRWSAAANTTASNSYKSKNCADIMSFELFSQDRHFTKSHAKIAGDCTHVIARLQTYTDAELYSDLIETVTQRRHKYNIQTWVDHVQLRPGFDDSQYDEVKLLSHWRQYPDGSNVIVAFNDSNTELLMIEDFLFGWFISPSAPDQHGQCSVNVSSIVAQPVSAVSNQCEVENNLNLSKLLLQRLQHSLPHHYDIGSMVSVASNQSISSSGSSVDNQRTNNNRAAVAPAPASAFGYDSSMELMVGAPGDLRPRGYSSSAGDKVLAIRTEVSNLNENERMMLDLLDKTISTQEVLAAQQHVMANVMDYHGSQLQRISSAIERVETILHNNGNRLKKLNPGTGRSGRHSIAL